MRTNGKVGQILLIAVLIGAILLISIPVIIFLNQMGAFHQAASQKRSKARAIAEEGIAYAARQLSATQTTWNNALVPGNPFTGTDCNGGLIPSPANGSFKITCSNDPVANPGLQPYEVAVTAVGYLNDNFGKPAPLRAMKAYLGQRTLGTDLANDLHAGAALQVMLNPIFVNPAQANPPLVVHWGPIVSFDTVSGPWQLKDPLDHWNNGVTDFVGYPRIFSEGGIAGTWSGTGPNPTYPRTGNTTASSVTTDEREYWAFASQTFPPLIDEGTYQSRAANDWGLTIPACLPVGCTVVRDISCTGGTGQCGYFHVDGVPGSYAIFDTYVISNPATVIYVDGDAHFNNIAIDMKNGGAFIVTGQLTLDTPGGGQPLTMRVPNTAPSDYYYWNQTTGPYWPCRSSTGTTTAFNSANAQSPFFGTGGGIQFRGFLYVKGNLTVTTANWNMMGSVLIGDMQAGTGTNGQLIINNGASLTLAYDDIINHNILVSPTAGTAVKVVPDLLQDIPTP